MRIIIPEFENVEKLQVTFLKDTALLNACIKFQNKGIFKLDIDSFDYKLRIDTFTFLSKHQALFIKMLPAQTNTVFLPLALPFKALSSEIKDLRKRDSVNLSFDLKVIYSTWFGKATLPYKKIIKIAVPIMPGLEVQKLEYRSRHKKTIFFDAHIKVINKGSLELHLSDIRYKLKVKDKISVSGHDERQVDLLPRSEQALVLPIRLELEHVFKTLWDIVTDNDQVKYHLEIQALARMKDQDQKGTELSIQKDGYTELKK